MRIVLTADAPPVDRRAAARADLGAACTRLTGARAAMRTAECELVATATALQATSAFPHPAPELLNLLAGRVSLAEIGVCESRNRLTAAERDLTAALRALLAAIRAEAGR